MEQELIQTNIENESTAIEIQRVLGVYHSCVVFERKYLEKNNRWEIVSDDLYDVKIEEIDFMRGIAWGIREQLENNWNDICSKGQ